MRSVVCVATQDGLTVVLAEPLEGQLKRVSTAYICEAYRHDSLSKGLSFDSRSEPADADKVSESGISLLLLVRVLGTINLKCDERRPIGTYNWLLWTCCPFGANANGLNFVPSSCTCMGYALDLFNLRLHMSMKGATHFIPFPLSKTSFCWSDFIEYSKCQCSGQEVSSGYFCRSK